ncbi:hypothetical protein [Snodgrassella alvi]|uniref:hypothetical protein n=1 Tax=Snodgrassella alvi TaxID=1196083 RepID=UPI000C1F902F|nr:hypothetical protein [Snodgrassella alvi]
MKFLVLTTALVILSFTSQFSEARSNIQTDDAIKQKIIDASIQQYPSVCACPYNTARNGSSCGKRSAWSRPGGYSPICYKNEVTPEMVDAWKKSNQ